MFNKKLKKKDNKNQIMFPVRRLLVHDIVMYLQLLQFVPPTCGNSSTACNGGCWSRMYVVGSNPNSLSFLEYWQLNMLLGS